MSVYTLSPIYHPQFVSNAGAALLFATFGAPAVVPDGFNYNLAVARVCNVTNAPCDLEVWRVPLGGSVDPEHIVIPGITIPVASFAQPYFDLTTLWSIIMTPGETIWAAASVANALTIHGDGAVISL